MKNNKGFTLIELLAVIVVLAIVMVLATTTVLPYMTKAREKAFRIEATSAVEAASNAYDLYILDQLKIEGRPNKSCKKDNKICFTIEELVNLGLYEGDPSVYEGTVYIDASDTKNPKYTLNFMKGSEYVFFKQQGQNFNDSGTLGTLAEFANNTHYSTKCSCEE